MLSVAAIAEVLAYYIPGADKRPRHEAHAGWRRDRVEQVAPSAGGTVARMSCIPPVAGRSPHRAAQRRQRLLPGSRSGSRTSICRSFVRLASHAAVGFTKRLKASL
jgi:hypothetical protein